MTASALGAWRHKMQVVALTVLAIAIVALASPEESRNALLPFPGVPRVAKDAWEQQQQTSSSQQRIKTLQQESDEFQAETRGKLNRVDPVWQNDLTAFDGQGLQPVMAGEGPLYYGGELDGTHRVAGGNQGSSFARWTTRQPIEGYQRPAPNGGIFNQRLPKQPSNSASYHEPQNFIQTNLYAQHEAEPAKSVFVVRPSIVVGGQGDQRAYATGNVHPVYPSGSAPSYQYPSYQSGVSSSSTSSVVPGVSTATAPVPSIGSVPSTSNVGNVHVGGDGKVLGASVGAVQISIGAGVQREEEKIRLRAYQTQQQQQQQQQHQQRLHLRGATATSAAATVTQLVPGTARRRYDRSQRGRSDDPGAAGGGSFFRSLMGVNSYCLPGIEGDVESECMLAPLCWLTGGVSHQGCNSLLYTCCVDPALSRKDAVVETGRSVDSFSINAIPGAGRWRSGGGIGGAPPLPPPPLDPPVVNDPECGITKHRAFSKRIIGGDKAKFAELPWQVHIRISSYQCGGVLLNHWYVATAAHCVHQAKLNKITVHVGEFDTKNSKKVKEPLDSEKFKVRDITLHPDFRYMLTQPDRFDLALLRLDRPVTYKENMIPICLPKKDYSLVGKVGVVAGWGKTDNSFGKTGTNLLNKVRVPIIDNRKCKSWHKDKAIAVQLHKEMFCAGHRKGKRDACLGDSGGPLVVNFEGRWTLVGITSAGFGCAVEKQPGIYHRVGKTARWISKTIYDQ